MSTTAAKRQTDKFRPHFSRWTRSARHRSGGAARPHYMSGAFPGSRLRSNDSPPMSITPACICGSFGAPSSGSAEANFQFRVLSIGYPMERTQNQKRSLANALSVLIGESRWPTDCILLIRGPLTNAEDHPNRYENPSKRSVTFRRSKQRIHDSKWASGNITLPDPP